MICRWERERGGLVIYSFTAATGWDFNKKVADIGIFDAAEEEAHMLSFYLDVDLEQERTRNRFTVTVLLEVDLRNYQEQEFYDTDAFFCMDIGKQEATVANTSIVILACFDSCNLLIPCVSPSGKTSNSLLMCWGTPTYTLSAFG
ncbi:hypothetical protein Tco_0157276 [Tanacetum coccineum]